MLPSSALFTVDSLPMVRANLNGSSLKVMVFQPWHSNQWTLAYNWRGAMTFSIMTPKITAFSIITLS
jgi:hypothetical protein